MAETEAFKIKLEGIEDINKALRQLETNVSKRVMRKALRAGAGVIQNEIKLRAPVRKDTEGGEIGGTLRKSISVKPRKKRRRGEISINVLFDTKKYPQLIKFSAGSHSNTKTHKMVGKRYFYPAALEYGTDKISARQFVRSGWDTKKRASLDKVIVQARKGIDREANRARK